MAHNLSRSHFYRHQQHHLQVCLRCHHITDVSVWTNAIIIRSLLTVIFLSPRSHSSQSDQEPPASYTEATVHPPEPEIMTFAVAVLSLVISETQSAQLLFLSPLFPCQAPKVHSHPRVPSPTYHCSWRTCGFCFPLLSPGPLRIAREN